MAVGLYLHYPNLTLHERQAASVNDSVSCPSADTFFDALQTETRLVADTGANNDYCVNAIYIGGATPNVDDIDKLHRWLDRTKTIFAWDDPIELTIAIAPACCSRQLLEKLPTLGVTRLDFGIGSLDRRSLRLLGRKQTTHKVHEAIYLANALGFGSFGCDFVYGLPGQTGKLLSVDMDRITDLDPPHITITRWDTNSERAADLTVKPPIPEFVDTLRRAVVEHLSEIGYEEYAGDRFARADHQCRYDADRAAGEDYIGLGPSAHSLVRGQRSQNIPDLVEYIKALEQRRRPIAPD